MRFKIKGKCALCFSVLKLSIDLTSTLPLSHISGRRLFSGMEKGKNCRSDVCVLVIGQNSLMMIV